MTPSEARSKTIAASRRRSSARLRAVMSVAWKQRPVIAPSSSKRGKRTARKWRAPLGQGQRFFALDSLAQAHRFQLAVAEVRTDGFGEQLQIGLADRLSGAKPKVFRTSGWRTGSVRRRP
jgi:hypothetical protein